MFLALKTPRLVLLPTGMRFLESTHRYASDRELTKYMMYLPNDAIEVTVRFLTAADREWAKERPDFYEFAVLLADGRHIGAVSLYPDGEGGAEMGWIISAEYGGNGYATEAARALARWALTGLGITRLFATCDSENPASYRVMEKLGMERVSCRDGRRNKSADHDSIELLYEVMTGENSFASARDTAVIRELKPEEYHLLDDFLYEAIFIPEGVEPPPRVIINQPELQVYVENFGSEHDNALIAVVDGRPAGMVWTRIMNDYGHIDDDTPSFAISLHEQYRGRGIGTVLMRCMLDILREKGYAQASLAVQKANYAVKMYKKTGFEITGGSEEEYIMVCRLDGDNQPWIYNTEN